jgi:peptidoglycan/xylan/chitin deacetylase (PgdA/CDA1 family)
MLAVFRLCLNEIRRRICEWTMRAVVRWLFVALLIFTGDRASAGASDRSVSILVYHRFGEAATELTTIRTATFVQELEWLRANRISVLPLHEVVGRIRAGKLPAESPSVVLTVDDGHESVYTQMFPVILRYRVPVTLFVYPSAISNSKTAMTWEQLTEMGASGLLDVQSHTFWHPNFNIEKSRLAPAAYEQFVRDQLVLSKSRIEKKLGNRVDLLSWPFGIHDPQLEKMAAEAGYVAGFTIERQRVKGEEELFALPRFEVTDADRGARFETLVTGRPPKGTRQ